MVIALGGHCLRLTTRIEFSTFPSLNFFHDSAEVCDIFRRHDLPLAFAGSPLQLADQKADGHLLGCDSTILEFASAVDGNEEDPRTLSCQDGASRHTSFVQIGLDALLWVACGNTHTEELDLASTDGFDAGKRPVGVERCQYKFNLHDDVFSGLWLWLI